MEATENVIEIEIDDERNSDLFFLPLGQKIRGRFDFLRVAEPQARSHIDKWGTAVIPGQRIALDPAKGDGAIVEMLQADENSALRQRITKSGKTLGPMIEKHKGIHVPTWLWHMRNAVECGIARIVRGTFPKQIEGTPRTHFYSPPPQVSSIAQFAAALERQNEIMAKQGELLAKLVERLAAK